MTVPTEPTAPSEDFPQEMTVDEIMAEINRPVFGELPRAALRAAKQHRDEIIPRLIESIRAANERVRAGNTIECRGPLLALYLLAEFEAKEALPVILDTMLLPDDGYFEIFGDGVMEDMRRILAVLAADTPEIIDELARNEAADAFVRWTAASTHLCWVASGRITSEEAVESLRGYLRQAIEAEDVEHVENLIIELEPYAPIEALPEIEEALEKELAGPGVINLRRLKNNPAKARREFEEKLQRTGDLKPIVDTVAELETWYAFQEDDDDDDDFDPESERESGLAEPIDAKVPRPIPDQAPPQIETIRYSSPRVGRNDPCPCGSGKKFKKCCGRG